MQEPVIELLLGYPTEGVCGQWIETEISLAQEGGFAFRADLCRRERNGDYSRYRLKQKVNLRLSAELVLGLLAFVARQPFTPSVGGLSISILGSSPLANREGTRILKPEVRAAFSIGDIPADIRRELSKKIRDLSKYREVQDKLLNPGSNSTSVGFF